MCPDLFVSTSLNHVHILRRDDERALLIGSDRLRTEDRHPQEQEAARSSCEEASSCEAAGHTATWEDQPPEVDRAERRKG